MSPSDDSPVNPLDALDELLAYSNVTMLAELDGFCAALAICPEPVPPEEWLPVVLVDEEGDETEFETEEQKQKVITAILGHQQEVAQSLAAGDYAPIYDVDPASDEAMWESWAVGFGSAMQLRPEAWERLQTHPNAEFADAYGFLIAAVMEAGGEEVVPEEEREDFNTIAADALAGAALVLYAGRHAQF